MGVTLKVGSDYTLDMTGGSGDDLEIGDLYVRSYNRTQIVLEADDVKIVIKGQGFKYNSNGPTSGTITGIEGRSDGDLVASLTGLKISVKTLEKLVESDSAAALASFVKNIFAGSDTLSGGNGDDVLLGLAGNDTLNGKGGGDALYGGSGNDKITGGLGADSLFGEAGKDTFIYASVADSRAGSGIDTIYDFSGKGGDRIDLSSIDAISRTSKNNAFTFVGTKDFSGKAGELRFEKLASDTYVYGDTNGDKIADITIHLDDAVSLSKGFFLL
jgi:Ca2+-binding RTX toxin-like protein